VILICSLVYFVVKGTRLDDREHEVGCAIEHGVTGRGGSDGTRTRGLRRDRPAF
jgi:hypothetical protein